MFITFEGLEGSGKTTQIPLLAAHLRSLGYAVLMTREPGGTPIGNRVRDVLHDVNNVAMTATAEILLYSASRAQLVGEVIRPALAEGQIVICDRYLDSTLAYQGYGRGLDLATLQTITRFATGGLTPDVTFYLAVEIEAGLARRQQGGDEMNRMDRQAVAFYRRVEAGYAALRAAEPDRWVWVAGDRPAEAVQAELREKVRARLLTSTSQP